ncbi:rhamnogalacturonan acetylesterase [Arcticibacter eurypsychrophilus]|uniref:rhamnogalacturonan acetylesterase n=1 Tax=Arcticibacter eurypsychrophilus TaxID=1434752 RepID=UPI00084D6038|nr:rhamnogalacturonan acetylesterase [Arcticibacter eurypsychrophilus]
MFNKKRSIFLLIVLFAVSLAFINKEKPTLFIIGDSTVRNTNPSYMGWGTAIAELFDTTKINVTNHAMAGRSTRTFIKEGRWAKVDSMLKPGDYVMMQFGHNEGSTPDTNKAGYRGVLKGTGEETKELIWPDGKPETVHTYGWYIRQFIHDAKAKGAIPIVLSMIPRNEWKDNKVIRANNDYGKWAKEVAQQEGACFIDLNAITADKYDKMGPVKVKALFPSDHTHTDSIGAKINAESVVKGLKKQRKISLNAYRK